MRTEAIVVAAIVLVSCTRTPDLPDGPSPSRREPALSPGIVPLEALPVPDPSPWPLGPDAPRDRAESRDVPVGWSGRYPLYVHCGVDDRVDFDGSFWQAYRNASDHHAFDDPVQIGRMTLPTEDVAAFRFEREGKVMTVYFVRNDTPKDEVACF